LPNGTVEDLKRILEGADGIYLSKELASKVDSKLIEANMQQKEISLEEEIELFIQNLLTLLYKLMVLIIILLTVRKILYYSLFLTKQINSQAALRSLN
jgi:hypothetical protein